MALLYFFFSALKPKFAASEKIKELSTELVMVNVEASEKLIITLQCLLCLINLALLAVN